MTDWFRSWHGAPTDNKWLVVARKANVPPAIVSAVVWALFDHASQQADRGRVDTFDVETYAAFGGIEEEQVRSVIRALETKGVIVDGPNDGAGMFLAAWDKRQPRREDGSSERGKQWRERKRTQTNAGDQQIQTREDTEQKEEEPRARKLVVVRDPRDPALTRGDDILELYSEAEMSMLRIEFDRVRVDEVIEELISWARQVGKTKPNEIKSAVYGALKKRQAKLVDAPALEQAIRDGPPPVQVSASLAKNRLTQKHIAAR